MKKNKEQKVLPIPETPDDIADSIFTYLHLKESEIFQLLYVDVDDNGKNTFQVYGRFKGEKIQPTHGEELFLLSKVDLKLINMNKKSTTQFRINQAEIEINKRDQSVDLFITLEEGKKQKEGVDCTLKTNFGLGKNQSINCIVKKGNAPSNRNGRPCNTKAYF